MPKLDFSHCADFGLQETACFARVADGCRQQGQRGGGNGTVEIKRMNGILLPAEYRKRVFSVAYSRPSPDKTVPSAEPRVLRTVTFYSATDGKRLHREIFIFTSR